MLGGIILAKIFAPELYGRFFSDQATVLVGAGVYNLGLVQGYRQIVSRELSLRSSYLGITLYARAGSLIIYGLALLAFLTISDRLSMPTVMITAGTLALSLVELSQVELLIFKKYKSAVILALGKGTVVLLPALICWRTLGAYSTFAYSYVTIVFFLVTVGILIAKPPRPSFTISRIRKLALASAPFIASIAAFAFTNSWGLYSIRSELGAMQAGIFVVPWKVYQVTMVVGMSVSAVSLPLFHKLSFDNNKIIQRDVLSRLVRGNLAFAGCVAGLCVFIPATIVKIVATAEYLPSLALFPILAISFVMRLMSIPAENFLESLGKQKERIFVLIVGAILMFAGTKLLLPRWGICGVAYTMLAVDTWILIGMWFLVSRGSTQPIFAKELLYHLVVFGLLIYGTSLIARQSRLVGVVLFLSVWSIYLLVKMQMWNEIKGFFERRQ